MKELFYYKNNHEKSLNPAGLVIVAFLPDADSYPISRAWCNGSYTMAAKSIKTLELRYPMSPMYCLRVHFIPWIKIGTWKRILRKNWRDVAVLESFQSCFEVLRVSLLRKLIFPVCRY